MRLYFSSNSFLFNYSIIEVEPLSHRRKAIQCNRVVKPKHQKNPKQSGSDAFRHTRIDSNCNISVAAYAFGFPQQRFQDI